MKTLHANRLNSFVVGNADAIGEMLSSLLGEPARATPTASFASARRRWSAP